MTICISWKKQRHFRYDDCAEEERPPQRNVHCVVPWNEQTLQEASMVSRTMWDGRWSQSDARQSRLLVVAFNATIV